VLGEACEFAAGRVGVVRHPHVARVAAAHRCRWPSSHAGDGAVLLAGRSGPRVARSGDTSSAAWFRVTWRRCRSCALRCGSWVFVVVSRCASRCRIRGRRLRWRSSSRPGCSSTARAGRCSGGAASGVRVGRSVRRVRGRCRVGCAARRPRRRVGVPRGIRRRCTRLVWLPRPVPTIVGPRRVTCRCRRRGRALADPAGAAGLSSPAGGDVGASGRRPSTVVGNPGRRSSTGRSDRSGRSGLAGVAVPARPPLEPVALPRRVRGGCGIPSGSCSARYLWPVPPCEWDAPVTPVPADRSGVS
jgi:hypothetical protein